MGKTSSKATFLVRLFGFSLFFLAGVAGLESCDSGEIIQMMLVSFCFRVGMFELLHVVFFCWETSKRPEIPSSMLAKCRFGIVFVSSWQGTNTTSH